MNLPEYRPNFQAEQAHDALSECIRIQDRARHCAVLWFAEIYQRGLYRELGFSSMNQYAAEALGFSHSRTGDFMRLTKKLDALPAIRDELASGRLGYTLAREIVPVADAANEKQWLEVAEKQSRRQLVDTVRRAKAAAKRDRLVDPNQGELIPAPRPEAPVAVVPMRVGFELTPSQYARYEKLVAQMGAHSNRSELLLEMMEAFLGRNDEKFSRENFLAPHQIHIHECPTCAAAAVATPRGERTLTQNEQEAARCDAQVHHPGRPNRSTIPPRIRREVLARDRNTCRRRGCGHTRHLHLHHLVPRADDGTHSSENLVTLCPGCHQLWHEKGGDLRSLLTEVQMAQTGKFAD